MGRDASIDIVINYLLYLSNSSHHYPSPLTTPEGKETSKKKHTTYLVCTNNQSGTHHEQP